MKFMFRRCKIVAVSFLVLYLFMVQFVPLSFAVSSDEVVEVLAQAEYDLGSAFMAVAEADAAGADVSVLLDKLDFAGDFLSEANGAFRVGNYETVFSFAVLCSAALEGVVDEAASLKLAVEKARSEQLVLTVVGSSVGLVLLLIFGFLGWRVLKRWYFKRVLDMKPVMEVV